MKNLYLVVIASSEEGPFTCSYPLQEGKTLLGKGKNCDIIFRGGPVSKNHVLITRKGDDVYFEDLETSAQTYLNGKVKEEGPLSIGDRLTLANAVVQLVDEAPKPPKSSIGHGEGTEAATATAMGNWAPFTSFLAKLRSSTEPKDLLERLLLGLVEVLAAERGFVLLHDKNENDFVPVAAHKLADKEDFIDISRRVYERALAEERTIFLANALADSWYLSSSERTLAAPRSILCAPLIAQGETFGVIYIDGPLGMTESSVPLFENVTGLATELLSASRTREDLLLAQSKLQTLHSLPRENRLLFGEGEEETEFKKHIERAAAQDISVLVTGETGTGKEMVAYALHQLSPRSQAPFVPVNCAALAHDIVEAELFGVEKGAYTGATERRIGRFELASGGTIFLDEIGELSLDLQSKLLRVLQERTISRLGGNERIPLDFRLICATNRNLEKEVEEGNFRQDLYYRINVFRLQLRPLRQRPGLVKTLADHFLDIFANRFSRAFSGFSKGALTALINHDWPGNIRELRNAIERAAIMETSPEVRAESLPFYGPIAERKEDGSPGDDDRSSLGAAKRAMWDTLPRDYRRAKDCFERTFIERSLAVNKENVSAVARETGLTRRTIYNKLEQLGLHNPQAEDE